MPFKLPEPKPHRGFLERVDIACLLRRWEMMAFGVLVASATILTAAAASASQSWDMIFVRGCLLIIFQNSMHAAFISGIAYLFAKTSAHELENDRKDRSSFSKKSNVVAVVILIYSSMYFLLVKNLDPLHAFSSCYIGADKSHFCNLKTSTATRKQTAETEAYLQQLRHSPWSHEPIEPASAE